ncbi:MAG: hypothetical protein JW782_07215 [Candidatus Saganbacteria bacterium]|nr:hypothetical protein [Candidatus Saganbacteria bacterium]
MRLTRKAFLTFAIILISAPLVFGDLDFPYGNFRLRVPPASDPFPGLGTYYSALDRGMHSALWNPASLAKLELSEAAISVTGALEKYEKTKKFQVEEMGGEIEFDPGSVGSGGNYGIFFRYPQDIGPGLNTSEVDVTAHANYATESTGQNFSAALKFNEWLSVGFSTGSPLEMSGTMAGDFPVTAKADATFIGQKLGDMTINPDGRLSYTITDPITVTYESAAPIWSGFLTQEAEIPLIAYSELRNNMSFNSPYTGTIAGNFGSFAVGINMLPISATANIDNNVRAVVDSDTTDIYLYTPDFDPEDGSDVQDWTLDPARYGTANGFERKDILLPAGEVIGVAQYKGFYSASTMRFDLGGMYDITDWLTVGLVLENFTGSSLNFKGTGRSAFYSYRDFNTAEADNFDDLMKPGGDPTLDLVSDTWTTSFEVNGKELYLEPQKNYDLPRRLRYGFALKKPILIVVDMETNQNDIKFYAVEDDQTKEYIISNINFLRLGLETQFFMLPMWLRGGLTLMAKPNVSGLDADAQKNFDDVFQFGYVPVKLDLGSEINAWGTIVGGSFGFNAQTILNMMQMDMTNSDLTKMLFVNTYFSRDSWRVNYLMELDPAATASAYGSKPVAAGDEREFEMSDLKFIQTIGVTYRF